MTSTSGTTSVPQITFTPTGLVLPQESAILAGVQADMNAAFGGNLNPNLNTPQGQVASSIAAIIADANALFAEFVNSVDPDTASGFMQDAIARIYFLTRNPGTPTAVQLVCTGQVGTPIPVGAQAIDTSNNIYVCTQAGTIPSGGSIVLSFQCTVDGPTPCPANTVTGIYRQIPGWDTVNNPSAGVPGTDVESQADFEFRRQNSVAANAHGSLPSIYAAVFAVDDVIDVYVTENVTDNTVNVGSTNFPVLPHSLYVAAVGGAAQDIGNAIWTKKDVGCNTNGNTSVTVVDTSGYAYPQPSYTINYEVPTSLPILFAVRIANNSALPSTIVQDVQNAIIAQFTGQTGVVQPNGIIPSTSGQRVRIGSLLLAAAFYGPVATCEGPSVPVSVLSILLGSVTATLTSQQIGIDQAPTITAGNISVTLV